MDISDLLILLKKDNLNELNNVNQYHGLNNLFVKPDELY